MIARKAVRDFGAGTALITAVFFVRNAVVLVGLSILALLSFR